MKTNYSKRTIFHFSHSFITNFKLTFMPNSIFIINCQSFINRTKLLRKRSQINEIAYLLFWPQAHKIKLSLNYFTDGLINSYILKHKLRIFSMCLNSQLIDIFLNQGLIYYSLWMQLGYWCDSRWNHIFFGRLITCLSNWLVTSLI